MKISVPSVLRERADQGVDRADIEMRRRLVHQQKVRRIEQQLDEGEARFLAAAQNADRLENIVAAKEKRAENGAGGLFRNGIGDIEHALENGLPDVEHLDAMLGKVTNPDVVPEVALALLHRQNAGEQFEEGRFAGAVRPDQDGALSALGGEVQ